MRQTFVVKLLNRLTDRIKAIYLPLICGLLLASCQTPPPEPAPQAPPAKPVENKAWLYPRLDAAEEAIDKLHLAYPEEGSALSLYEEILVRYPEQEDALRGLERIVEEYVALAIRAGDGGQFARARSMLDRAKLIVPDHPSIEPTNAQIQLLSKANRRTINISQDNLTRQDQQTSAALAELGGGISGHTCRFEIRAINDAQGRQIYAALSRGTVDGERIRAQVKIQLPAGVERVCFEN